MTKEMHNIHISLYVDGVLHSRYKDDIYVCGLPGSVPPHIYQWCATLGALSAIPVLVEKFRDVLDVLESTVLVTHCDLSMRLKCKTLDLVQRNTKPFCRWPDAWALSWVYMGCSPFLNHHVHPPL